MSRGPRWEVLHFAPHLLGKPKVAALRAACHLGILSIALGTAKAQVTERVSVKGIGRQVAMGAVVGSGNADKRVSADGRFVAFQSDASDLVPGDVNGVSDVFLRDRIARTTELISVSSGGVQGNRFSGDHGISISSDGRFVVFDSNASNLTPGDSNGKTDAFLRDRILGTTECISSAPGGGVGDDASSNPAISAYGRFVTFTSAATNLVQGGSNGLYQVFVRDRLLAVTEIVSVSSTGSQANGWSIRSSISDDGRFVAFESAGSNLVLGDSNGKWDIFVRDRSTDTTDRVSLGDLGQEANNHSGYAEMSGDGRYVVFASDASNLVSGDTNGVSDYFVRDLRRETTERINVSTAGVQDDGSGERHATISADGRFVAFESDATHLVPGDTTGRSDVFLRDRWSGTTERISVSSAGAQADNVNAFGFTSEDGRFVAFMSYATNLVADDTNASPDFYVRDRAATGFTSLCNPGVAGVISCPCANPPASSGRGCDNSGATGGASIVATGAAYLGFDSLVFSTSGEVSDAQSTLFEGAGASSAGFAFGQGVRCASGPVARLYTKRARSGGITAPDLSVGDVPVSVRSAARGVHLQPGQAYLYFVAYRDPVLLGGCPATSTFNTTQTGRVSWWP